MNSFSEDELAATGKDRTYRIAVVDDDPADSMLISRLLEISGRGSFQVIPIEDFDEASRRLRSEKFDVALIDNFLGVKLGVDLIRELGGHSAPCPLIMLTGGGLPELDLAALDAGVEDFIDKNDLSAQLLARVVIHAHARFEIERELRQSQADLTLARDAAETASIAKSEFLAQMSHEIRTPMNGVLGMAAFLARTELTAEQRESVNSINDSGTSLLDILNDILDLSKIEAGRIEVDEAEFFVADVLKSANMLWARPAQDKGLAFSVQNKLADSSLIRSDRGRLRQIINNLVSNAIKFTSEGNITLLVEEVQREDEKIELRFETSDTGIGLTPEQIEILFQPFTQADASTTRKYGGTGLGLSICKKLVELLGGEIGVESTIDEGSKFWFTVVAGRAEPGKADLSNTENLVSPSIDKDPERTLHVLIAEDNYVNQKITSWLLAPLDCQIDIVENGLEAVAAVTRSTYDLVLMDIHMPEMDGIIATQKIRSLTSAAADIPIIAMTADTLEGDREAYLAAGMNDLVVKPIDQREFLSAISYYANVPMPKLEEPPEDRMSADELLNRRSGQVA